METSKQIPEAFSVGQAFNLAIFFLVDIWSLMESKVIEEEQKTGFYSFFFIDICSTFDCHAEWNEAIRLVLHVPKEEQRVLQLSLSEIFSCIIEFCKIFNEYFNTKIGYAIDLLESMRKNPKNHKKEWAIWLKIVTIIAEKYMDKKDNFDWSDYLCPWKAE